MMMMLLCCVSHEMLDKASKIIRCGAFKLNVGLLEVKYFSTCI